jgi:hypothetical protein
VAKSSTSFGKGQSGNPGGGTAEQAEAKRILAQYLTDKPNVEAFWAAYKAAGEGGNASILIDWANRLMGKVKDESEVTLNRPLSDAETEDLKALLKLKK